mmetsp:Transcript_53756/g.107991  ORF Transcript_53756/g.107991 Transcript_53756/m.107991 type:complete len:212 (+) Transcript_53756:291-926(+)
MVPPPRPLRSPPDQNSGSRSCCRCATASAAAAPLPEKASSRTPTSWGQKPPAPTRSPQAPSPASSGAPSRPHPSSHPSLSTRNEETSCSVAGGVSLVADSCLGAARVRKEGAGVRNGLWRAGATLPTTFRHPRNRHRCLPWWPPATPKLRLVKPSPSRCIGLPARTPPTLRTSPPPPTRSEAPPSPLPPSRPRCPRCPRHLDSSCRPPPQS